MIELDPKAQNEYETVLGAIEEFETKVAPEIRLNHNETLVLNLED